MNFIKRKYFPEYYYVGSVDSELLEFIGEETKEKQLELLDRKYIKNLNEMVNYLKEKYKDNVITKEELDQVNFCIHEKFLNLDYKMVLSLHFKEIKHV